MPSSLNVRDKIPIEALHFDSDFKVSLPCDRHMQIQRCSGVDETSQISHPGWSQMHPLLSRTALAFRVHQNVV